MSFDDSFEKIKAQQDNKRFEESVELCNKILADHSELLSDIAIVCNKKGFALTSLGKPEEALTYNSIAVAFNPQEGISFVNRSFTLGELGRYNESISDCEEALKLNPNYAKAWNNKGYCLHKLGKSEEGLKDVEKALELDPSDDDSIESKKEILEALEKSG